MTDKTIQGPHQGQPVLHAGAPLDAAKAAMIMIHGRGASAENILTMAALLDREGFAYLAPQAQNYTWYPHSFLSPIEANEPGISSGLALVDGLMDHLNEAGIPADRVILLGFSQGACLATTYAARNAKRFGGVAGLSGGLIGPPGTDFTHTGSMDGTPIFLGCSDIDPHIPKERVHETASAFEAIGADVTVKLYPGMGHLVNDDELDHVRVLMDGILKVVEG